MERLPQVQQAPDFNELQNVRETPAVTPWLLYSRIGMLERFDSKEYPIQGAKPANRRDRCSNLTPSR